MNRSRPRPNDDAGFYEPYSHYNNLLRTWLVAYGIGGPAVLITNQDLFKAVAATGRITMIGWLFLAGVAAQVLVAFVNKVSMWYLYYGDENADFKATRRYRFAHAVSEVFWPDLLADFLSIGCIGGATVLLFRSLS